MTETFVAQYQHLVYGNDQLLLKQEQSLNVVNNVRKSTDDDISASIIPMEPERIQQKIECSGIEYCPFFVEIIDAKDKNTVYGYIRQQCELLSYNQHMFNIPIDIIHIILYHYCFDRYQYDGCLKQWTKKELKGRYLPQNPIKCSKSTVTFTGKSTHYSKQKHIKFGTIVVLKKLKHLSKRSVSLPLLMLREIKTLRTVSNHPSIIQLCDVISPANDTLILIYKGMDSNLKSILKTQQYFSPLHVQYVLYHILLGVKYIHDANIVHRNLRPACILMNADCSIKITSFRTACGIHEKKERRKFHVGHRWYRAPETILRHHTTSNDLCLMDMWSVGCIFAELLQMKEVNCSQVHERCPLFPGDSCYPMTPKRSTRLRPGTIYRSRKDQLRVIFSVIGRPKPCAMEWLTDRQTTYVEDFVPQHEGHNINLNAAGGGMDLLKCLLDFDLKTRFRAADALQSAYFDRVRDKHLENKSPPKRYTYPQIKQYCHKDKLPEDEFTQLLSQELKHFS